MDPAAALSLPAEHEVFVVNADGSGRVRVTMNAFQERDLAWVTPPCALR